MCQWLFSWMCLEIHNQRLAGHELEVNHSQMAVVLLSRLTPLHLIILGENVQDNMYMKQSIVLEGVTSVLNWMYNVSQYYVVIHNNHAGILAHIFSPWMCSLEKYAWRNSPLVNVRHTMIFHNLFIVHYSPVYRSSRVSSWSVLSWYPKLLTAGNTFHMRL